MPPILFTQTAIDSFYDSTTGEAQKRVVLAMTAVKIRAVVSDRDSISVQPPIELV